MGGQEICFARCAREFAPTFKHKAPPLDADIFDDKYRPVSKLNAIQKCQGVSVFCKTIAIDTCQTVDQISTDSNRHTDVDTTWKPRMLHGVYAYLTADS